MSMREAGGLRTDPFRILEFGAWGSGYDPVRTLAPSLDRIFAPRKGLSASIANRRPRSAKTAGFQKPRSGSRLTHSAG